ncbi:hypothetical protein ACRRRS_14795 [Brucella anthropi]|uniref:hypothetical protein n=1 Tax=Brucella anthropi TaxID=529 RepID=UPI003D7D4DD8
MKKNWEHITRFLRIGLIVAIGVAAAYFLPLAAYENTASVVLSFAGIIVAALVPTMILAATILSPMVKGKNEFQKLKEAVSGLISYFAGLFLWTLVLGAFLVFGALLQWKEVNIPLSLPIGELGLQFNVPITRMIGGVSVSIVALIIIQMTGFIHGVRFLFKMHSENVEKEIDNLLRDQARAAVKATMPKDPRSGIGENIGILE